MAERLSIRVLWTLHFEREAHPPEWLDVLPPADRTREELIRRVLTPRRRHRLVVLNGAERVDQIAAILIRLLPRPPAVLLSDCAWKTGSRLERTVNRVGARLLDGAETFYCVTSTDEVRIFPQTWGVDPGRVFFTPFCVTLPDEELDEPAVRHDGGIFAGGDSMRDYGPLLETAGELPARVTLATSSLPSGQDDLPPNVIAGPVPHDEYQRLLRDSTAVVVPMAPMAERSAGQQTYLNAMALGKVVVVTDTPGARDYVRDGETGIIVPAGDSKAIATALRWVLDPANAAEVENIRRRARATVLSEFRGRDYRNRLLEIVETISTRLDGSDRRRVGLA